MKYKIGDLVYFENKDQKGVGEVTEVNEYTRLYRIKSTQIVEEAQWWFRDEHLKPFTKKVGQKYKVIREEDTTFEVGSIVTLEIIYKDCASLYVDEREYDEFLYDLDHKKCEVEFYKDAPEEEEETEVISDRFKEIHLETTLPFAINTNTYNPNKDFTMNDVKVGMLVEIGGGNRLVLPNTSDYPGEFAFVDNYGFDVSGDYSTFDNVKYMFLNINKVHGHTKGLGGGLLSTEGRSLLWERKEPTKMTIKEIESKLGVENLVIVDG